MKLERVILVIILEVEKNLVVATLFDFVMHANAQYNKPYAYGFIGSGLKVSRNFSLFIIVR
jgi:hypothetical protein